MKLLFATAVVTVGSWFGIPGGSWNVGSAVLNSIHDGLEPFVKQQASNQHQVLRPWPTYSFQYQGQTEAGRKIVFINAFCGSEPDAQQHFVQVFDGGPCYFRVKYDPLRREFFELVFNGVA